MSAPFAGLTGLNRYKAERIYADHKHEITGVVMRNAETHEMCIVELCAVRWLDKGEAYTMMHPTPDDQAHGRVLAYVDKAATND